MSLKRALTISVAATAFLVTSAMASKPKDSKNVVLSHDATVAGSHLESGDYNIQWQTHSPTATISFWRKGKVIATMQGKVVDRGTKYHANQVVYADLPGGERTIQEIRFRGSSEVVVLN